MKRLSAIFLILILLALPGLASQVNEGYTPEELLQLWYQAGALLRENGLYPYVELRKGDTGYEVLALQERLTALNYYDKDIVPVFGGGTEGAMRRFERVNKLRANGWASAEDQVLLFKSIALPNTGTTVQPQMTQNIPSFITNMPGPGATPQPLTPTPATTLGEPVTAPPVTAPPVTAAPVTAAPVTTAPITEPPITIAPVVTFIPHVTFKLPGGIVTPKPFFTAVLPIKTPPPFELTDPIEDLGFPMP